MNILYQRSLLFVAMLMLHLTTWANQLPTPMLEESANNILHTLKINQAVLHQKPSIIYNAVEQYMLPNVDVDGMSRSVLGRQIWIKATPNERVQFAKAFTKLVIRTYAAPLAEYTGETIKFLPIRTSMLNARFIRINSIITRPNGATIPLSYNLVSKNGQWKIYDLSVEGISLLQSFKAQFAQVLLNSNMSDLVSAMNQRYQAKS